MSALVLLGAVQAAGTAWLLTGPGPARQRLGVLTAAESPGGAFAPAPSLARWMAGWVLERRRRVAMERALRAGTVELCFGLAAELRAGRTPMEALRRAAETLEPAASDALAASLTAAQMGGDVAAALRGAGRRGGAAGLGRLAACWQVGAGSGAGLAVAVERLARALRAEEAHREEVTAQLAGPRATARLLAALPFLGLAMAAGLGTHPVAFLLGTPYGAACLVLGLGLDALGLAWTRRLARTAWEVG